MIHLLHLFLTAITAFLWGMSFLHFQTWRKNKEFKYVIKGNVDDIIIDKNKLYFVVKWLVPDKIKDLNPGANTDENAQFYHFFVKKVKTMTTPEQILFINKYINKHAGRLFVLKAKVENGVIRQVTHYEDSGILSLIFFAIASISSYVLWVYR